MDFVCTPAQHSSGRGIFDQSHILWAGWVVCRFPSAPPSEVDSIPMPSSSNHTLTASIYHTGETGYATASGPCPAFSEIGEKYGSFDLAMIPIWHGASLSILRQLGLRLTPGATHTLLSQLHTSPRDALALARDVRAPYARHAFRHVLRERGREQQPLVELVEVLLRKERTRADVLRNRDGAWRVGG